MRAMTAAEFAAFREHAVRGYGAAKARAGDWTFAEAEQRADEETDRLLPHGRETAGMLLVVAETEPDGVVGHGWVALDEPRAGRAWIYDIEVAPEQRGKGYGRALLGALERLAAQHGSEAIGLNVFGGNAIARALYESSGYETTSLQMRKPLG